MFKLNFATPDKKVISDEELEFIIVPAYAGTLDILPGHAPLMTTLEAGILEYKLKSGEHAKFAISWGYCQVSPEGVNVLAESAMAANEIDTKVVADHLRVEENKLATESLDDAQWETTQHEIARLKAELELVGANKGH